MNVISKNANLNAGSATVAAVTCTCNLHGIKSYWLRSSQRQCAHTGVNGEVPSVAKFTEISLCLGRTVHSSTANYTVHIN